MGENNGPYWVSDLYQMRTEGVKVFTSALHGPNQAARVTLPLCADPWAVVKEINAAYASRDEEVARLRADLDGQVHATGVIANENCKMRNTIADLGVELAAAKKRVEKLESALNLIRHRCRAGERPPSDKSTLSHYCPEVACEVLGYTSGPGWCTRLTPAPPAPPAQGGGS